MGSRGCTTCARIAPYGTSCELPHEQLHQPRQVQREPERMQPHMPSNDGRADDRSRLRKWCDCLRGVAWALAVCLVPRPKARTSALGERVQSTAALLTGAPHECEVPTMSVLRRCVGQWWLPGDPDRKVGGVLEVDSTTGLRLEVTDRLLKFGVTGEPIPIIFGAADGRQITLLDTYPANGGHTVIAQVQTTFEVAKPSVAMVGIHLEDDTEAVFNGLAVEMTGLTTFAGKSGLRNEYVARPGSDDRTQFTMSWTDPIETLITDPFEATLGLHWELEGDFEPKLDAERRRYRADETVVFRVTCDHLQPWRSFLDLIRAVQDLVTLATQSPAKIMRRTLEITDEPIPYTVDLYLHGPSDATDLKQNFDAADVIFSLDTVDFATVVNKWLDLRGRIGLAVDVLLGLDYQPAGYYEVRLFNVAAAGEGIHAGLYPDRTAVDPDQHEALKKAVSRLLKGLGTGGARTRVQAALSAIQEALRDKVLGLLDGVADAKQREWVMNQIGENRPGLTERYKQLAETADSEAVEELLTSVEAWAAWLRDARNAVGHGNPGRLREKIPENVLYRMVYISRALFHLVLLKELGIDSRAQRRAVREIWGFSAARFRSAVLDATQDPQ
jgi:hypothetical protein